jgi:hypothetical protein
MEQVTENISLLVDYGYPIKVYKTKISSTKVTLPLNPKRIYIIDYMIVGGRLVNQ